MHYRRLDVLESGLAQKPRYLNFSETEPQIRVQLSSLFVTVTQQVENDNPSAWLQNTPCLGNRTHRMLRVMQRLAEEGHIHSGILDGYFLQIAFAVFEIFDAVFKRQFATVFHHLLRVVDRNYFLR